MWATGLEIILLILQWGFAFWTGRKTAANSAKEKAREIQDRKFKDVEMVLKEKSEELSRASYYNHLALRELLRKRQLRKKAKSTS